MFMTLCFIGLLNVFSDNNNLIIGIVIIIIVVIICCCVIMDVLFCYCCVSKEWNRLEKGLYVHMHVYMLLIEIAYSEAFFVWYGSLVQDWAIVMIVFTIMIVWNYSWIRYVVKCWTIIKRKSLAVSLQKCFRRNKIWWISPIYATHGAYE